MPFGVIIDISNVENRSSGGVVSSCNAVRYLALCFCGISALFSAATAVARPLTIDDVLEITTVDRADVSPFSDEIAIAMPRPAGPGEVYGRNSYEIDPSRNDIWLVKRDGTGLRQLTDGQADAAGYWCPYWSPDGKRLAMLSTAPERDEPRGGDNVRVNVWERFSDKPRRVSNRAVVTQVRYGSPLNELDLRAPGARQPNSCRRNDENAPFLWLDSNRLLVLLMPPGEHSAMVDRFAKFHREAARSGAEIRSGEVPTASRSSSGSAANSNEVGNYEAELVVFNLADGSQTSFGTVPAFPMSGALTLAMSPDARRAAILAPVRAIEPHRMSPERPNVMAWAIEQESFLVDLEAPTSLRRVDFPQDASYPLDIIGWSPQSDYVALRARPDPGETSAGLWSLNATHGAMSALAPDLQFPEQWPSHWREPTYAFWADRSHMIVYGASSDGKGAWRFVDAQSGKSAPFDSGWERLDALRALANGALAGKSEKGLVRFDPTLRRFELWQPSARASCEEDGALVPESRGDLVSYVRWSTAGQDGASIEIPAGARILDYDCTGIVWAESGFEGSSISFTAWDAHSETSLLMERNRHLAEVSWGERRMIDYTHTDGSARKMVVLLPSDYDPAKRYPTLLWVYGGYSPSGTDDFFLDPQMSGFYNLQLYASRGYVVAVASIPIPSGEGPNEPFTAIPGGVLPAIDELVELGITDNARVGVFGQSFGGYTVSTLVAQTDRFAAAATLAGASDLATNHAAFDPAARGWPGVAQDMAANAVIYEAHLGFEVDPGANPALYDRNSPLTYVDQIDTPLLIVHGELDSRAPLTQAEALYSLLRRRGRTARLLRYWGENHSLANSPANVRDISRELISWFDQFVKLEGRTNER